MPDSSYMYKSINNKNVMKKLLIVLLIPAFMSAVYAQKPSVTDKKPAVVVSDKAGWHKIGETTANFKTDRDELIVLGADKFKSIKIKVTDAPIHISNLEVYYESGDKEDIILKSDFKAGGESRVVDLKGNSRDLKKVVFVYNTVPNAKSEKAHVELYGLK